MYLDENLAAYSTPVSLCVHFLTVANKPLKQQQPITLCTNMTLRLLPLTLPNLFLCFDQTNLLPTYTFQLGQKYKTNFHKKTNPTQTNLCKVDLPLRPCFMAAILQGRFCVTELILSLLVHHFSLYLSSFYSTLN